MSITIWGLLQKSQTDPETIEEAIARIVDEHNEDETAHLGAGQSLQSHKASEIIDHVVASIIADKIKNFEIGREKLSLNRLYIRPTFESLDNWNEIGAGIPVVFVGGIMVKTTTALNDYKFVHSDGGDVFEELGTKNAVYEAVVKPSYLTNQVIYFGLGDPILGIFSGRDFIGFKILNGSLYACWVKDGVEYITFIFDLPDNYFHSYRVENIPGEKLVFSVDGVVETEATTNIPTGVTPEAFFSFYIKTTTTAERYLKIINVMFHQEE